MTSRPSCCPRDQDLVAYLLRPQQRSMFSGRLAGREHIAGTSSRFALCHGRKDGVPPGLYARQPALAGAAVRRRPASVAALRAPPPPPGAGGDPHSSMKIYRAPGAGSADRRTVAQVTDDFDALQAVEGPCEGPPSPSVRRRRYSVLLDLLGRTRLRGTPVDVLPKADEQGLNDWRAVSAAADRRRSECVLAARLVLEALEPRAGFALRAQRGSRF